MTLLSGKNGPKEIIPCHRKKRKWKILHRNDHGQKIRHKIHSRWGFGQETNPFTSIFPTNRLPWSIKRLNKGIFRQEYRIDNKKKEKASWLQNLKKSLAKRQGQTSLSRATTFRLKKITGPLNGNGQIITFNNAWQYGFHTSHGSGR